ncbi:MAG TPA: hypothetical protein VF491_22075, partial [Vicinamibacterales bacterium]
VGFHWLRGMIHASRQDAAGALECFNEEIAAASAGHIYGREFAANAHAASGFTWLAGDNIQAASASFARATSESIVHPKARVGEYALAVRTGSESAIDRARAAVDDAIVELGRGERAVEAALVAAGAAIARGDASSAIGTLDRLLTEAPAGPAGWIIPIDPMLAGLREYPGKSAILAKLAARAV